MKILKNKEQKIIFFNILSFGTTLKGEILINGDFRVDGTLDGSVQCENLIIGSPGYIDGLIKCKNVEISGKVNGDIYASELIILNKDAKVNGNIFTSKLIVELGATLSANCNMKN